MLKESIKKEQDPETQENMKGLLMKMVTQNYNRFLYFYILTIILQVSAERFDQEKKRKQELLRDRKKQESELVKQGKNPYFLKKCKCLIIMHYSNTKD